MNLEPILFRAPFFLPWLYPNLIWKIAAVKKEIYLTFDDGPIPGPTNFVLETLKRYNCKATFFCIGKNVQENKNLFKRIVEEGHVIGNHTFNHLKGWSTQMADYVDSVKQFDRHVRIENPEIRIELFRPPYGRITRRQIRALHEYKIIMWDVLTNDYNINVKPDVCLKNSIRVTRPGSIVVFHDSLKAEPNMTHVLPRYIEHFLEKGYTFKPIPN